MLERDRMASRTDTEIEVARLIEEFGAGAYFEAIRRCKEAFAQDSLTRHQGLAGRHL